jgi:hypothetical protein
MWIVNREAAKDAYCTDVRPLLPESRAEWGVPLVAGTGKTGNGRTSHPPGGALTVEDVNRSSEIREFVVSRRARITPQQAGLLAYGANRRVKGLRREEVAMLAGVSVGP